MKYKVVRRKGLLSYGYYVKYRKWWWPYWKYVMRHGEKDLRSWWSTMAGAQAYINQQKKNGEKRNV